MPDTRQNLRVDLRLLLELGERLISRDEVAIVELVKNAYDADADVVTVEIRSQDETIEIRDNGEGMDADEITEGWLTLGTKIKQNRTTTSRGRRVLGEKGIGRLAILRLGKEVTILTQKSGKPTYRIVTDWRDARARLTGGEYTPLSDLAIGLEELAGESLPDGHGTRIVIEDLNADWEKDKVERLKVFLSKLVEPREDKEDRFEIEFIASGQGIHLEPPAVTRKPHYSLKVDVVDGGEYSGTLAWHTEAGEGSEDVEGAIDELGTRSRRKVRWKPVARGGCGPFAINVNVWDLDASELRGSKTLLRQWSGISLVRDGFRVVQPDVDWLGLGLRRVQNPTLRLSTNQVIGSVLVSADGNPRLIDKTDREGLLENEGFNDLKETVYDLLGLLERKRYKIRRSPALSRRLMFDYLDDRPLRRISRTLPKDKRAELETYAGNIQSFRKMLEEWVLGRDRMATMGMLAARLVHSARSALAKITDNYPLIEKSLDKLETPLRKRLLRVVRGGRMLARVFSELDPFIRYRGRRREIIKLEMVVGSLEFLFQPDLRKKHVSLRRSISPKLTFKANLTDIYVMIANLVDNALYWVSTSEGQENVIEVRARSDQEGIVIEVADTGRGLDPADTDEIFGAGFTRKEGGTGLGLSIVRDIAEFYGGRIDALNDDKLGGALFRVNLPLET